MIVLSLGVWHGSSSMLEGVNIGGFLRVSRGVVSLLLICGIFLHCIVELLCAVDNNWWCHLWHGGHKASDRLCIDIAILHHYCGRRLGWFLRNGCSWLWLWTATRPRRTCRPARHRTVCTIPQLWKCQYQLFDICLIIFSQAHQWWLISVPVKSTYATSNSNLNLVPLFFWDCTFSAVSSHPYSRQNFGDVPIGLDWHYPTYMATVLNHYRQTDDGNVAILCNCMIV